MIIALGKLNLEQSFRAVIGARFSIIPVWLVHYMFNDWPNAHSDFPLIDHFGGNS